MKGKFIVLEGPDGAGTTLHSRLLAENLEREGHDVVLTAEPTEGGIGRHIRGILDGDSMPSADAVQLLFCADRAQHVAEIIIPALGQGKTVVSDRYALSTIVYGAALGLDQEWLEGVNSSFPKPDITVITLPPFEVCQQRLGSRSSNDQFEKLEFQKKIYSLYESIQDPNVQFVDTSGEKESSAMQVMQAVLDNFE